MENNLDNIKSGLQKLKTSSLVKYFNIVEEQAEDLIEENFSRELHFHSLTS